MKKQESEVRSKVVFTRMNSDEYKKLVSLQACSTERSLSSYQRKVLLKEPVTVKYRNTSADDFLKEMVELKKQLNGIGNNFNQAVHKLHILDRIPEFRSWLTTYRSLHEAVVQSVEEIKVKVAKLYTQWLLK